MTAYIGSVMATDILAVLVYENLTTQSSSSYKTGVSKCDAEVSGKGKVIVAIAHDWGTYLLSQLTFRYPNLFTKVVFVSVPYQPPARSMDIAKINALSKKEWGYEQYGYWLFLVEPETSGILGKEGNWESLFELAYAEDAGVWKEGFAGVDAMRGFVEQQRCTEVGTWVGSDIAEEKMWHRKMFGRDYTGPTNWYRRAKDGLGVDEERGLLKEGKVKDVIDGKDVLFVGGLKDAVCPAERSLGVMAKFVEEGRLMGKVMDAGHWIMLEQRDLFNQLLEEFVEKGVGGGRRGGMGKL